MSFVLGPNAIPAGYRLFSHDSVGSTSAEAMKLARAGDPGGVWVAALEQTEGIGRRGRHWDTPHGNLAASVFVVAETSAGVAATLGFVAGLSLLDALAKLTPALVIDAALDGAEGRRSRLALKWPNDVVAGGAKIAGILLQAERLAANRVGVVAGIGVNVISAPAVTGVAATSLAALGAKITAEELFVELAESWIGQLRVWDGGAGLPAIRRQWMERATGIGQEVSVRVGEEVVRGRFETIDDEGHLVVALDDGRLRKISAGEVHLGAVASLGAAG
jgi:BirA family biotin operon repressor/biotin-[acetyl-CoA-carboxylase] ligase